MVSNMVSKEYPELFHNLERFLLKKYQVAIAISIIRFGLSSSREIWLSSPEDPFITSIASTLSREAFPFRRIDFKDKEYIFKNSDILSNAVVVQIEDKDSKNENAAEKTKAIPVLWISRRDLRLRWGSSLLELEWNAYITHPIDHLPDFNNLKYLVQDFVLYAYKAKLPLNFPLFLLRVCEYHPDILGIYREFFLSKAKRLSDQEVFRTVLEELSQIELQDKILSEIHMKYSSKKASTNSLQYATTTLVSKEQFIGNEIKRDGFHVEVQDTIVQPSSRKAKKEIFERNIPLSQSCLWQDQKRFYLNHGIKAWSDNYVPFAISSNSFIAQAYAEIAINFIMDKWKTSNCFTKDAPCYIMEAGSGHCQFGYLFLKHLRQKVREFGLLQKGIQPCVILSDINENVIRSRMKMDCFQEFLEEKSLDFAVFDCERIPFSGIHLLHSNVFLTEKSLRNPFLFIGNYLLDSLPADIFKMEKGVLKEGLLTSSCRRSGIVNTSSLKFNFQDLDPRKKYYSTPFLDQTLDEIVDSLGDIESQFIIFPKTALELLKYILSLHCNPSSVAILCGDATIDPEKDAIPDCHYEPPQLTPHESCFCLPVDMTILTSFLNAQYGFSTRITQQSLASFHILFSGSKDLCLSTLAFQHQLNSFGVVDYEHLVGAISACPSNFLHSIEAILGLLELSCWDFNIFTCVKWTLASLLKKPSHLKRDDVIQKCMKCFENRFSLESGKWMKLSLEWVQWLVAIGEYEKALKHCIECSEVVAFKQPDLRQSFLELVGHCHYHLGKSSTKQCILNYHGKDDLDPLFFCKIIPLPQEKTTTYEEETRDNTYDDSISNLFKI